MGQAFLYFWVGRGIAKNVQSVCNSIYMEYRWKDSQVTDGRFGIKEGEV